MSFSFSFDKGPQKQPASAKKSSLAPSAVQRSPAAPIIASTPQAIELPAPERVNQLKEDGNTLAESGFFVKALQKWDEALNFEPSNALLHELRAQVLLELGEDELALEAAAQAVEHAKDWSDAHLTLGRVYVNLGLLEEAKESMERSLILTKQASDENGRPWGENSSAMEVERELDEVANLIALRAQRAEAALSKMPIIEEPAEKPSEESES